MRPLRGLVRHVAVLGQVWPAVQLGWSRLPQPVRAFLIARVCLTVLAAWSVTSLILAAEKWAGAFLLPPMSGWAALLVEPWTRWDGQWYLRIATEGYGLDRYLVGGETVVTHATTAFFPLYPLLVWLVARVPGVSAPVAGVLVSSLATLGGLVVLHRLIAREISSVIADRTVRYLLIFPTAFFFFAVYTESLFLFTSVCALAGARWRRWWIAGIFGALTAASRPPGILILLPLAIEYVIWLRETGRRPGFEAIALIVPLAGLGGYLAYLQATFGDPLAFVAAQQNLIWQRRPAAIGETLLDILLSVDLSLNGLLTPQRIVDPIRSDLYYGGYHEANGINLIFWLGALIAAIYSWRKVPLSWTVFSLALLIFPLSGPVASVPLQSFPRFILPIFPIFAAIAIWAKDANRDRLIVYPWLTLLGIFTVRFVTWYWVA